VIIDAHMHIGTWDHVDFLGRSCTLDDALTVLGESGIDGGALVPTDQCDNEGLWRAAHAALVGGYAGQLWFFPWVRPSKPAAQGESDLAWVRAHLADVTGLKIHPSLSRHRITDDVFRPALELADEHEKVVLVHCGRWQEMASFRFAIEAAQSYPRARFLLAHAGGDTPPLATAACEMVAELSLANVFFEFSGLREYWVIERNVRRLGASRYLMGSDYCLAHPRMYLGAIDGMRLPDADKDRIRGHNAIELFGAPLRGVAP